MSPAKECTVRKWRYAVVHNGKFRGKDFSIEVDLPDIGELLFNCGYCHYYCFNCYCCPMNINDLTCKDKGHPFNTWVKDQTQENAQTVLDLVLKI